MFTWGGSENGRNADSSTSLAWDKTDCVKKKRGENMYVTWFNTSSMCKFEFNMFFQIFLGWVTFRAFVISFVWSLKKPVQCSSTVKNWMYMPLQFKVCYILKFEKHSINLIKKNLTLLSNFIFFVNSYFY